MSEPKLISPLLDGFSMGAALSAHDGVRCYPALKEDSETRYIVKIISIPAAQSQLDALLLTGAYREPRAALEYFRELADAVEAEAGCLKNLARLEGFLAFEGWQVVPMEHGDIGYQVYLLSSFRQPLEKYVRKNNMTHLGTVNLGIDICNALSAARRAGWIYVDLKPSNIFLCENGEYRIGDLGLMQLENLDLAALPAKYRSAYTAPELLDEMLSPNTTLDTYALGLILYQLFNDGQLPQVAHPGEDPLPPPANADYELAEILLKACAPDPANRWENPVQMGQALVAYMQRNTVSDAPIIPPMAELDEAAEDMDLFQSGKDETLPDAGDLKDLTREDLTQETGEMMDQADALIHHQLPAPPVAPEGASVEQIEADVRKAAEEKKQAELQAMLEQLAQQETQEAVRKAQQDKFSAEAEAILTKSAPEQKPVNAEKSGPSCKDLDQKRRQDRRKAWLTPIAVVLVLSLLGGAGFWFYNGWYTRMINGLSVVGSEDAMTVQLDTDISEELLTVVCTDTYGNSSLRPVENGCARFEDLLPDMLYKIRVEIEGFHRLTGSTTHEYVTPAETSIVSFTAATGPEDGSVILNFTVDGPDSEEWTAICTAEDAETVNAIFTGHMTTVTGLNVGSTYQIRLVPSTRLYIPGTDSLTFTASSIIIAENLSLTTDGQGGLTVSWTAPEGAQVESWDVRCYSVDGYDQILTTDQLTVTFQDISPASAYTVEVTAAGMTQPARAGITANPIYVSNIQVDDSDPQTLGVSWDFSGNAPVGGWLLMYTIDGCEQPQVVQCESNSGIVEVRVPAATYEFTIRAADGSTVYDGIHSYRTPNAAIYRNETQMIFESYQSQLLFVNLLKTPAKENWNHMDVTRADFTTSFRTGDPISIHLYYMVDFYIYHEDISVMYVIRDEQGNVISDLLAMENRDWHDDMWNGPNYHYCCLNIPKVPTQPGTYTLGLYFDGMAITSVEFTISE